MEEQHFFIKGCPYSAADPQLQHALERIYESPERPPECVELRVDFPHTRVPGRTVANGERREPCEVGTSRHRISLRAVMHFLFERAGLNRWSPSMEGKRNQGVVHKYVTQAAEEMMTKGLQLSERLYVPEPFRESNFLDKSADFERITEILSSIAADKDTKGVS